VAKHRAETGKRASTSAPKHVQPRHRRRRRKYVAVAPVAALALVAGGGGATALTRDTSKLVDLDGADNSWAATAAVMASRQDLLSSRGGSRVLLGADRIDAIETQARKTLHDIKVREAERIARQEAAEERRQERIEARQWGAPVASYSITATFGESSYLWSSGIHTGVDLNAVTGTPVTSVGPGVVTSAGYDGSYGNKIVVEHADGMETWYCHLSAINVSVGQSVTNATVIGLVGATGNVTGDHLHLELRPAGGGDPVDPVAGLLASHGLQL
jgi:murein DD-endopeptidase MepM/ murein hydrolase activator NlpD